MGADRDANILRLYQEGVMLKDIGDAVGVSGAYVGQILKRLGVPRPPKPQKRRLDKPDETSKILELWDRGLSASQIAERVLMSRHCVGRVLSLHGRTSKETPRHRYDSATPGGSGRKGFAGAMARRT